MFVLNIKSKFSCYFHSVSLDKFLYDHLISGGFLRGQPRMICNKIIEKYPYFVFSKYKK